MKTKTKEPTTAKMNEIIALGMGVKWRPENREASGSSLIDDTQFNTKSECQKRCNKRNNSPIPLHINGKLRKDSSHHKLKPYPVTPINYHKDWNKLMDVIENIEGTTIWMRIYFGKHAERHSAGFKEEFAGSREAEYHCEMEGKTRIEAAHKAVYQYLTTI